MIHKHMTRNNI